MTDQTTTLDTFFNVVEEDKKQVEDSKTPMVSTQAQTSIGVPITYPDKPDALIVPNENLVETDVRELQKDQDFDYARRSMHHTIDVANDALANLLHFANTSGGAQAYKEVAGLVKSMVSANTALVELHDKRVGVTKQKAEPSTPRATQQNAEKIENHYHNEPVVTPKTTQDILDAEKVDNTDDLWAYNEDLDGVKNE